jgi:hypothetical protein
MRATIGDLEFQVNRLSGKVGEAVEFRERFESEKQYTE